VTDEEQIKAAATGADIHCPFCGTRNPATAKTCSQCGGDLTEGKVREAGRVMQAPPAQPKIIKCTNCGTENPGRNTVCSNCGSPLPRVAPVQAVAPNVARPVIGTAKSKKVNWILIGGILAFFAVCCVVLGALFLIPAKSVKATVTNVHWETSVPVQEIRAVNYNNEEGSPPSDAYNVSCHNESQDVCQNKTIDKGNGYSEVVQECQTETKQYCSYTRDEWKTIQTYTLDGHDLQPLYESPNISNGQRLGDESEDLAVTFSTQDGEQKNYSPSSVSEFQQFQVGSTWTLQMNALGGITSVKP
jgi:ribosomal protein L40E